MSRAIACLLFANSASRQLTVRQTVSFDLLVSKDASNVIQSNMNFKFVIFVICIIFALSTTKAQKPVEIPDECAQVNSICSVVKNH